RSRRRRSTDACAAATSQARASTRLSSASAPRCSFEGVPYSTPPRVRDFGRDCEFPSWGPRATLRAHRPRPRRSKERPMSLNKKKVIAQLNRILECELAGVVRYTHYSMMIFGYSRIPIVAWFQAEATESLAHAQQAGEMVTRLGGHPSLAIGPLLETHQHDIGAILRESLQAESAALALYRDLLGLVEGRAIGLEEFARKMIHAEETHAAEVDKMLRKPGDLAAFAPERQQS